MHRIRAYLSTVLAVVLLTFSVAPAFAVSQADLQKHQRAADAAKRKAAAASQLAAQLADQTVALDKRIDSLQADVDKLDPIVAEAERNRVALQNQVEKLRREVAALEASIRKTQGEYDRQSRCSRRGCPRCTARATGTTSTSSWEPRTSAISSIAASSSTESSRRTAGTRSNSTRPSEACRTRKHKLQVTLTQVSEKRTEAAAVEKRWRGLQGQRQSKVAAQQAVFSQKKTLLAETRKNLTRLRAIAAAEDRASDRIAVAARRAGRRVRRLQRRHAVAGPARATT